ncbi:MAG: VanZ family protein [Elusimicrobiota bacterium]|nr:VanZ family protein [Elusimicrobiota bacterium]
MAGKVNFKKLLPPLVWAGLIFYLSSIPSLKSPFGIWDFYLRKAAHITEYLILCLLIMPNFSVKGRRGRITALLLTAAYAVTDEYHQKFVPGRHMNIYDIYIDWIGGLLGYIYTGTKRWRNL